MNFVSKDLNKPWKNTASPIALNGKHQTDVKRLKLIAQQDIPEAFFYANDKMAIGGFQALSEKNIRVMKDISRLDSMIFNSQSKYHPH
jgi:hypothetical protein